MLHTSLNLFFPVPLLPQRTAENGATAFALLPPFQATLTSIMSVM